MTNTQRENLIHQYINAYNRFDIDGMLVVLSEDIQFQNVSGAQVTAQVQGKAEFQQLAEQAKQLFSARCQTIKQITHHSDYSVVQIDYQGVLSQAIGDLYQAGQTLALTGQSDFYFTGQSISKLIDRS